MGYRDETDGLRTRVADLEAQLEDANAKIARLTGEGPRIQTGAAIERSAVLGASSHVVCERILDFEIEEQAFERIAEVVRPRLPRTRQPAQVAQVGRTLQAPGFFLESRNGRTHVRMEGDYRSAAGAALGCTGLGGGFLAMVAFAVAHDFFLRTMTEAHLLWMVPIAVVALFPMVRALIARNMRKQEAELRGTFETVLEIANGAAIRPGGAEAVRVAQPRTETNTATSANVETTTAAARDAAAEVEAESESESAEAADPVARRG